MALKRPTRRAETADRRTSVDSSKRDRLRHACVVVIAVLMVTSVVAMSGYLSSPNSAASDQGNGGLGDFDSSTSRADAEGDHASPGAGSPSDPPSDDVTHSGDQSARSDESEIGGDGGTATDDRELSRLAMQGETEPRPEFTARDVSDDVIQLGESVTVTVSVRNAGADAGPWSTISASFPALRDADAAEQITILDDTFADHRGVATAGDTIRNSDDQEMTTDYALVEAGVGQNSTWDSGNEHTLTLEVTPTESGDFPIYLRGTLTDEDDVTSRWNVPSGSLSRDQQGHPVYMLSIEVVDDLAVTTDRVTGVTEDSATAYGSIEDRGRDASVAVAFEYRAEGADSWQESATKTYTNPQNYKVDIGGLAPGTTYEYRAIADNGADTARSEVKTFTTTGEPEASPVVATGQASNIGTESAVLEGELVDEGSDPPVAVRFEYRENGTNEWEQTAQTSYQSATAVAREISGLEPGTEYDYRVLAESAVGAPEGDVRTFTTDADSAAADGEIVEYDAPDVGTEYELDEWYDVVVVVRNTGETAREFVVEAQTPSGTEVREASKTVEIAPGSTERVTFEQRWYGTYTSTRAFGHDLYVRSPSADELQKVDSDSVALDRPAVGTAEIRFKTADGESPSIDYRIVADDGTVVVDSTVSGGDGKVHTLKTGTYTVEADADGYEQRSVDIQIQTDSTIIDELTLSPEAAEATIENESFTVEEAGYDVGDSVRGSVTVRNTGSVGHEFFVGMVVRPSQGDRTEFGPAGKLVELEPGEEQTVEVAWQVGGNVPVGAYDAAASVWPSHPELGVEPLESAAWKETQFSVVRDAREEQVEYNGTTYTIEFTADDTILVLDEDRQPADASTAEDVLNYYAFTRNSNTEPSVYREDLWELTESATNMDVYYFLAHGTEAAISVYKAYVTTHVTGQPAYGEVIDLAEQAARVTDELTQDEGLANAANSHLESAQVAHKYYSDAELAVEYGSNVKTAYERVQAGEADSYLDAFRGTMTEAEWHDLEVAMAMRTAWAGFDDATGGLKITAKKSLVLMNWGKASQLQLDMLANLAEKRDRGEISQAEMDLYYKLKLAYYGSTAAMADRLLTLQEVGEEESLAFKYLTGVTGDRHSKDLYRGMRDSREWDIENTAKEYGEFRAMADEFVNSSENIHGEPETLDRFANESLSAQLPGSVEPGEPVTVTVTSGGSPVPDAELAVGDKVYTTDQHGEATIRLLRSGQYTMTVRKDGYQSFERPIMTIQATEFGRTFDNVEIGERDRDQEITESTELTNTGDSTLEIAELTPSSEAIDVTVTSESIAPGESELLTVTLDGRQFDPGPLSETVTIDWARSNDATEIAVSGELVGDVSESPAEFVINTVETSAPVEAGEPLEVTAEIENAGDQAGSADLALGLGDRGEIATKSVDLEAGNRTEVMFTYETTADDVGDHDIVVSSPHDEHSTTITVEESAPEPGVEFRTCTEVVITGKYDDAYLEASYLSGATDTSEYVLAGEPFPVDGETVIDVTEYLGSDAQFYIDYVVLSEDGTVDPGSPAGDGSQMVENPHEKTLEGCAEAATGERPEASIAVADQESDGETVTVDSVELSHGGFVAVYDASEAGDDPADATMSMQQQSEYVLGASEYLDAGSHENVEIVLDEPLAEGLELVAIPHRDSTGSETFEFVASNGEADWPYHSQPPFDTAAVTIADAGPDETDSEAPESGEREPAQPDEADEPGQLDVAIVSATTPVQAGDRFELTAEVTNSGGESVTQEVALLIGEDRERTDAETVTVAPGDTATVTLGYETYPVEQDVSFPVSVTTDDAEAEQVVEVDATGDPAGDAAGTGHLDVTITGANDPVSGGDRFEVTVRVQNTGNGAASQTVQLLVGEDREVVDTQSLTVDPGATQTLTLGYETYPVQQRVTFPVYVASADAEADRIVEVTASQ